MTKIAIDARIVTKQITGSGRVVETLLGQLGMFPELQFVVFHLPEYQPPCRQLPHVKCIECSIPVSTLRNLFKAGWLIRKERPDVVYYPFVDVPLFIGAPTVAVVYDLFFLEDRRYFAASGALRGLIVKLLTLARLRSAAGMIVISNTTGDQVRRQPLLRNIPIEKVDLCVHQRLAGGAVGDDLKQLTDRPYFLYVGNNRRHKNIPELIRVYREALTGLPPSHSLYLCGAIDPRYEDPRGVIRDLGLEAKVRHHGPVSDEALEHLYEHAQAVIIPSQYEGFGLPALEAAHRGKPIICSEIQALREVMGDAAVYCELDDDGAWAKAMIEVAGNEQLRQTLGRAAAERAKLFSPERLTRETVAFCLKFAKEGAVCAE
jgi:glycosyltransferase involved in cell wall biosynthesis